MIRLFLDQGLPRSAAGILRDRGFDCVHASEAGLHTATDLEIIEYAQKNDLVIVTLDADFHALLMVRNMLSPSTIRLRLEGLNGGKCADTLEQVLRVVGEEILECVLVTVKEKTIRVHRMRRS